MRVASARGPVALMRVAHDGVTVTTRSGGLHADAVETEIVDTLGIDVRSETAEELAQLLVRHMRRRMRESDPEPRGPALVA